eukprot:1760100-Alexandrium_andersonii.AAC.1
MPEAILHFPISAGWNYPVATIVRARACDFAMLRRRTPSSLAFVGRLGLCANNGADCTTRELRGPILRPFPWPHSSAP